MASSVMRLVFGRTCPAGSITGLVNETVAIAVGQCGLRAGCGPRPPLSRRAGFRALGPRRAAPRHAQAAQCELHAEGQGRAGVKASVWR